MKFIIVLYVLINCFTVNAKAENYDNPELLKLVKACVDIGDFDNSDYDIHNLMIRFLYTYRNFEIITDKDPQAIYSDNITICRSDFVKDAFYKAFRINPPTPRPDKLTKLGYCENNGFYFFTGGYSEYFATDVSKIVKIIPLSDNDIYVIFKDSYQQGTDKPVNEYSSMTVSADSYGYFVKSIRLNDDFELFRKPEILRDNPENHRNFSPYAPVIVIAISFILVCLCVYLFFIRR